MTAAVRVYMTIGVIVIRVASVVIVVGIHGTLEGSTGTIAVSDVMAVVDMHEALVEMIVD
ncbi:MAG: hypothetical protein CL726_03140 [Chloroflexi bacterium]|jgi:hypothetical protein|nr:hypothetical protein [Chloroflexota bacterium]|tara:strand:+ start:1591 stop:1770 length:180 start_codon:yes stop_codon:yes gene_type:complete